MWSAPNAQDTIKGADVVVSTNNVIFLTNRFPRLISVPTFTIFALGKSGITAMLINGSVNPIVLCAFVLVSLFNGMLTFMDYLLPKPYFKQDRSSAI